MIDDPIVFKDTKIWPALVTDWFSKNNDDILFFDHTVRGEQYIGIVNRRRKEAWSVNVTLNRYYLDKMSNYGGKEYFFSTLMTDYPDYFEWFLFHPEYLK